jgi:hypothetical protein
MFNRKLKLRVAELEARLEKLEARPSQLEQEITRRLEAEDVLNGVKEGFFGLARYSHLRRSDKYIEELAKKVIADFHKESK